MTFEIKEEFLLDKKPFKILSGAIHYFRIHPSDWRHSLYNLKALGFNTVETYVPWNMHEPQKGQFCFEGMLNLEKFVQTAAEVGLFVILRPSPYICAEWEFGGLPAWLLEEDCRIRSSDPKFLTHVQAYYQKLLPLMVPYQLANGGPIIMMQVENEYGSYGEDKQYLQKIAELMRENGITTPFFTSDGAWLATLRAGSMIDANILPTGNFGSKGELNFENLKSFHELHGKNWPLMCMEFWDGWFNRWGESVITRDPLELAKAVKEVLELGSINLYMFHGGTNYGFMNGCSARGTMDLPQITSYDYGAPLDEQGNPTEKYYRIKEVIHELFPEITQMEPIIKSAMELDHIQLNKKVSLFEVLEDISKRHTAKYPVNMEALDQFYGYMVYRTKFMKDAAEERFRIIDGRDRAQVYLNNEFVTTQYQAEIGEDIQLQLTAEENQLDIVMENMGRVNYGHKLLADTQRKGIRTGAMIDLHFLLNWEQFSIDFDKLDRIDFNKNWRANEPAFYQYKFEVENVEDTFLDVSGFGKGVVFVNGFNLGRFWEKGPYLTLYIAKALLRSGENEIVFFETEGVFANEINLVTKPIVMDL